MRRMKTQHRYKRRSVDGILLLDKPTGLTSNAALQKAKYLYRAEKAGHTGSLDPLATGLLPIFFGQATKLCAHLLEADKRYCARVRLGQKTNTGDADGEVIARSTVESMSHTQLAAAIPGLLGEIEQIPPMYSAIKRAGQHLYEYARQGIEVEREPRRVTIRELRLIEVFDDGFAFEVLCSKGTYVRTLAEDWAAAIGQYAHLTQLRRLETGAFNAQHMVTSAQLEALANEPAALEALLLPLTAALTAWPQYTVNATDAVRLRSGLICGPYDVNPGPLVILDASGMALFIAEADRAGRVSPKRWLGPENFATS